MVQEQQIADEEARLDRERKALLNELRQRMAAETALALSEQEKRLGELIGRLQVRASSANVKSVYHPSLQTELVVNTLR